MLFLLQDLIVNWWIALFLIVIYIITLLFLYYYLTVIELLNYLFIWNFGRFGFSIIIIFDVCFGLDVMNYWFLYLCHLLFPLLYFICWFESSFIYLFFIVGFILYCCFIIISFFLFIVYFELAIILLLFQLLVKSYSNYRVRSSFIYFLYSSLSSLFLFIVTITIIWFLYISYIIIIGLSMLLSLAIKVPIWPFQYWLTIVHSEASTSLSLLLASIILKLGIYAIIRFCIIYFYISISYYISILILSSMIGIILPFLDLFLRLNFKILIALSSISYMNIISAAISTNSFAGFYAAVIISISHGLSSISLFLFTSIIINKSLSHYIDSIWFISISYRFIFFVILLANLSFPFSLSFIGEFLALFCIFAISFIFILIFLSSSIVTSILFLVFFNRVILYLSLSFIFYITILDLLLLLFFGPYNYFIGSSFLLSWIMNILLYFLLAFNHFY